MQLVLSNIKINLPLSSSGPSSISQMFSHPLQYIPMYRYNIRLQTLGLSSEANKLQTSLSIVPPDHSYQPPLGNFHHMCISALILGLSGRSWINASLVEWNLSEKKVQNSKENGKCDLPLTDELQRSREKQNCPNNITNHLASRVLVTKLST